MKFMFLGEEFEIRFVKGNYLNNGNLYIGIQSINEDGEWDNFSDITVNFSEKCPEGCGFLQIANMPREVYQLIRPLISETGRIIENGITAYPEVRFDSKLLNEAIEL